MNPAKFLAVLLAAGLSWGGPLAVVMRTEGKVAMTTEKGDRSPKAGDLVLSNWKISTGRDGQVRLRLLADRTLVDLKPDSRLSLDVVERADRNLRRAFLLSGDASFSLSDSASDFRAETQTSVSSGKMVHFSVSTGLDGSTSISVVDGNLSVCNPSTGDHATLWQGSSTTSTWDGISSVVATAPAADEVQPAAAVDSGFGLEVRMIDPSSGATSSLRYGLEKEK